MASMKGVEDEIHRSIRSAGITLRFDRVARRVVDRLKAALGEAVPKSQAVVVTITAPIRKPAKAVADIERIFKDTPGDGDLPRTVHGNSVGIRRVRHVEAGMPTVCVFIHNSGSDAGRIFMLAEQVLAGRDTPA